MFCFNLAGFESDGFFIGASVLSPNEVADAIALLQANTTTEPGRGGIREVMDAIPALRNIASHEGVRRIVGDILGPDALLVRATLFDKSKVANWKVPWHQDVTIAVKERRDTEGYGPWSSKAGVHHVQPPTAVLNRMVSLRLHLDPCPADNGALRVMPGTHHLGHLKENQVAAFVHEELAVTCEAEAGDALIMRPLLLHASSPSKQPAHRRVLHFDFATGELANGLAWHIPC